MLPSDCWVSIMYFVPKWAPILEVSKALNAVFKDLIKVLKYDKALSFLNREYYWNQMYLNGEIASTLGQYTAYSLTQKPEHIRVFMELKRFLTPNEYISNDLFAALTQGLIRDPKPFDLDRIDIWSADSFITVVRVFREYFDCQESQIKRRNRDPFTWPDWSPLDIGFTIGLKDNISPQDLTYFGRAHLVYHSDLFLLGLGLGLAQNELVPLKQLVSLVDIGRGLGSCMSHPKAIELFKQPDISDSILLSVSQYIKLDEEVLKVILSRPDLLAHGPNPKLLLNPSLTWELLKPHLHLFKHYEESIIRMVNADFEYLKRVIPKYDSAYGVMFQCIINPNLTFDETEELINLIKVTERNGPDVWSDSKSY